MRVGGACLVAATVLLVSSCAGSGGEAPKASAGDRGIEPGSRAEAQNVLDKAAKSAETAGTGQFLLRMNLDRGITIGGVWDLKAPATDYSMTMHGADDDGKDVVVRTRLLDNTAFSQVSTLDDNMCWMKLDSADREAMDLEAGVSAVHPAALMLLEPHALGFVKDSAVAGHQDVRAEVAFDEAASAVLPKAFNQLSEPPPDDATIPVTVGINAGSYASIRFSVADIIRAAKDHDVDLFAGAEDVADAIADAKVEINYRSFGDEVDIDVPAPDLIVDVDMASLQESGGTAETCKAAR